MRCRAGGAEATPSPGSPPGSSLLGIAWPIWRRVLVLFLVLCGIKLALLAELNRHLYQIHWRISSVPTTWLNQLLFYAFIGIGGWSLVALGQQCRQVGTKTVRIANGAILGLGLLFIFLTFHTGDKNYLYPIMVGTLNWGSLGPYLSLDLFFRSPFLAAWLFGYALAYYVMWRTGREAWVIHLTAVCASVYGLLCLRDLMAFRSELLVADCLGLSCLLAGRGKRDGLKMALFALPIVWTLAFWIVFRFGSAASDTLPPYFVMLAGTVVVLFGALTLLARKGQFVGPWASKSPFYFAGFLLLTNANYPEAANYSNLLCLSFGCPQYFLGEMALAALLVLSAWAYTRLFPRHRLWWLDAVALILIAIAIADFGLTKTMGQRLEWDVLTFGNSPKMMWRMARPFLPAVLGALASVALVYVLILQVFKRQLEPRLAVARAVRFNRETVFVLSGFLFLSSAGMFLFPPDKGRGESALRFVSSTPLFAHATTRTLTAEEFLQSAQSLGLGNFAQPLPTDASGSSGPLNVVLIFMESSYNKHLSLFGAEEETQPLLSKYKDRMEIFPNFFSNFAGSIHARFATFTSLYPVRDYNAFTLHRVPVKSIFEVLHDHHYTSSLFYSSFFDYTGFGDFLKDRNIDQMYDADTMPVEQGAARVSWGLSETATLGAIQRQIRQYASQSDPFFLTYLPAAPHYPYDRIPARFCKFKKVEMDDYEPLYLNELLYMDWVITSIIDELAESGLLDKTLVIITNDHGEMLGGKDGPIGHGWAVTPELANTPLIVMDPRKPGYHINDRIGSQIDLLPTVLDHLGIPTPKDQLYQGRSLYRPEDQPNRITVLNSYSQFGILSGTKLCTAERESTGGSENSATQRAYTISNKEARTVFTACEAPTGRSFSVREFEAFQASLLRDYSRYCALLHQGVGDGAYQVSIVSAGRR